MRNANDTLKKIRLIQELKGTKSTSPRRFSKLSEASFNGDINDSNNTERKEKNRLIKAMQVRTTNKAKPSATNPEAADSSKALE